MKLPHLKCARCGREWVPRVENPASCPGCHRDPYTLPMWRVPAETLAKRAAARAAKLAAKAPPPEITT